MKLKFPASPRDGIRAKVIWPAGFLLVCVGILIFIHRNEPTPPPSKAGNPEGAAVSNTIQKQSDTFRKSFRPPSGLANQEIGQLIVQLSDSSLPLKVRRQAARELAKIGTDEAMAALKTALASDSPPYLKAAIAEALGECPNAEAGDLLRALANGKDETTARGAARGLALRGDTDAVETLGSLLFNAQTPVSVRTEAALALGDVDLSTARDLLMRAMAEIKDVTVLESVLDGLGKRPFAETEEFFRGYLNSPDVSTESKVAAIEALGDAQGNVAPFLLKFLSDANPDIRAAAAWALNSAEPDTGIAPQLTDALRQESDPKVRARLYEALANQSGSDAQLLLPLVQNETDPVARLAGWQFLAGTLQSSPEALAYFNQTAVPELQKLALSGTDSSARLGSVMALARAKTPEAINALRQVVQNSGDQKVVAAAKGALQRAGFQQ